MIRINLLPIRQARKRESVKQQLILGGVLLVGALIGLYLWYSTVQGKIDDKKKQIKQAEQQIEQYKKAIGEVEKYKGLEETLQTKLQTIESLVKGKTGPVRVLDKLSQLIPKQVWLLSWDEQANGNVVMEGEALSNKYVAQFMTLLKESDSKTVTVAAAKAPSEAAKPGAIAAAGKAPKVKSFFSNIKLKEVTAVDEKKNSGQSFVKFVLLMKVNYSI